MSSTNRTNLLRTKEICSENEFIQKDESDLSDEVSSDGSETIFDEAKEIQKYARTQAKKKKGSNINTIDNLPNDITKMWNMVSETRKANLDLLKAFFEEALAADNELEDH